MSRRIVFFGNERIATGVTTQTPVIRGLLDADYEIAAIVINSSAGVVGTPRQLEIAEIAHQHSIPLLVPNKLSDISNQLRSYAASVGVLAAYGKLVPQSIIEIFPGGIINIHPSLLPKHRGPTPLESAILDGDSQTGVSLMQLVKEMDAGPVYAQSTINLHGDETKQALADELVDIGAAMLTELLPEILSGTVVAKPQDNDAASYDSLIQKSSGQIDWHKTARQLEREIRAYAGWPQSRTTIAGIETIITKAHVEQDISGAAGVHQVHGKSLLIHCGQQSLAIDMLKPAGKSDMPIAAFLAGYGQRLSS